jgi:14-3-3 protein epsilon
MKNIRSPETLEREELIYLARLSEQTERYPEMIEYVKHFVSKSTQDLQPEERNIFSVAYKNLVSAKRTSWRVLNSIEQKEERRGNSSNKYSASSYKSEVETELLNYCNELLTVVDRDLIPKAVSSESRVFFHKMKGDYFRYIAEFAIGPQKVAAMNNAETSYTTAYDLAKNELPPTHPSRLGLALNFSVFYYEIRGEQDRACAMAKSAFDEAIPELENIGEDNYKDSTLILQLLKDNLTLWSSAEEVDNN